jgi:hypothetical protein
MRYRREAVDAWLEQQADKRLTQDHDHSSVQPTGPCERSWKHTLGLNFHSLLSGCHARLKVVIGDRDGNALVNGGAFMRA